MCSWIGYTIHVMPLPVRQFVHAKLDGLMAYRQPPEALGNLWGRASQAVDQGGKGRSIQAALAKHNAA